MARPRTPLLSRPLIRETALRLVDEHGLDELSMRKIAAELGVRAPSLYSHYANKDELLDDIADRIGESVDVGGFDTDDWQDALRRWARSYRAALAEHHNLSDRERQMLMLLAQGYTKRSIGTTLCLSEGTVKTHIAHLYSKLGVHSQNELAETVYGSVQL